MDIALINLCEDDAKLVTCPAPVPGTHGASCFLSWQRLGSWNLDDAFPEHHGLCDAHCNFESEIC